MLGALGIDAVEVGLFQTLSDACSMYHIVELMVFQLLAELFFRREVQLDKVDAFVRQKLA